ncbi:MAG: KEOPS complex subunit Pcc1 [Candidatus Micrarchaeota archaeon]
MSAKPKPKFIASISIPFPSANSAQKALSSLEQETTFKKRSSSHINVKGSTLHLTIEADDLAAFRASLNSYMRLVKVVSSIVGVIENISEEEEELEEDDR